MKSVLSVYNKIKKKYNSYRLDIDIIVMHTTEREHEMIKIT